MMRALLIALSLLGLTGCINMTTRLQADDLSVAATYEGEDCVPIFMGIGIGTATMEGAMAKAHNLEQVERAWEGFSYVNVPMDPIQKIRRLQFSDYQFLGFGARCIEVVGEGSDTVKTSTK